MARTDSRLVSLLVNVVCASAAGCSGNVSGTSDLGVLDASDPGVLRPVGLTDPAVRTNLHQVSLALAKRAEVEFPATMVAVAAADHQAAEAVISGAILDDHSPVYVVQMTGGTFTSRHHPYGIAPPHGNVLTVTFDAATLRVTDVGYDSIAPDLRKIDVQPVNLVSANSL